VSNLNVGYVISGLGDPCVGAVGLDVSALPQCTSLERNSTTLGWWVACGPSLLRRSADGNIMLPPCLGWERCEGSNIWCKYGVR
jgi:hypothetical protein